MFAWFRRHWPWVWKVDRDAEREAHEAAYSALFDDWMHSEKLRHSVAEELAKVQASIRPVLGDNNDLAREVVHLRKHAQVMGDFIALVITSRPMDIEAVRIAARYAVRSTLEEPRLFAGEE